ncbi:uncharacterized protein EI90DRAFT_3014990 [Cantharellus anzutake]|uniref:uncharacterized protein n=1 Tax=Cantharellus anzutake TaxID=1750568 RepID=UPI00190744EF|nr:uncharacterized protein EI90DRAFT_3014990 [Cantharellus anzutake]KAF8334750.1 hypothetical protein EI90DRAFT_3014990 [Cantharellus anzutake]
MVRLQTGLTHVRWVAAAPTWTTKILWYPFLLDLTQRSLTSKHKYHEEEAVDLERGSANAEDRIESNLLVPNSTYDACSESFIAADGEHIKASTDYFADTGVMAILCHHDIPLFLVNIQTAGKKQHYLFALIAKFFEHIPDHWQVGILYDIGSPEWGPHIAWGVSIFHAYGHQFACQLWYRPRKSECWGLTDGKGCKRVWSQLWQLVPGLHITGHYHRLFLIDIQAEHIESAKLPDAGKWLKDRFKRANERLQKVTTHLATNNCVPIPELLEQFDDQRLSATLRTQEALYDEVVSAESGHEDYVQDPESQDFVQKVAAEVAKLKQSLTTAMQAISAQVGEAEE